MKKLNLLVKIDTAFQKMALKIYGFQKMALKIYRNMKQFDLNEFCQDLQILLKSIFVACPN